jgi:TctA family transporter
VTGAQELIQALRTARQRIAEAARLATPESVAAQEVAVGSLDACLKRGLPALTESESELVAAELKQLLVENGTQMRWAGLRSRLAKIGTYPAKSAVMDAPTSRLDLVS